MPDPEHPASEPAPTPPVRRILALDVGDRRIGVALSDALGFTAQPLLTVFRSTPRADVRSVARLIHRHAVAEIVVGDPIHLSGELSRQAERSRSLAAALAAEIGPGIPVSLLDERLTTAEAHARLDAAGGRRRSAKDRIERSGIIDQLAAVLILEAYLERDRPALLPPPPAP